MAAVQDASPASISGDTTRAPSEIGSDGKKSSQPNLKRRGSVGVDYFDAEGTAELSRRLSRMSSRMSTTTQDPSADDFNYETHLKHILRKAEKQGVKRREIGVSFKDLRVTGKGAGVAYGPSMADIALAPLRIAEGIRAGRNPVTKDILKGFTGDVRPGEMLLVLGRPGSGCTSLLKVLANNTEAYTGIHGEISYDGATPKEMAKHHAGDIAYLPEDDVHLPTLTVGETLTFASATRTPAAVSRLGPRKQAIQDTKDVLLALFGLRHTVNTKVGNDVVRGVSGGERKRVSIAELLTTGCKIGCHDNSTRGLDASTALEYARALRLATDIHHFTTVLSIYQAGEQIYNLFDKVCVIYAGRMVYFGRMGDAVDYFVEMGYQPQNRQTSADFLVAVTDPNGRFVREGYESKVPRTADEFADYFDNHRLGKANRERVVAAEKDFAEEKIEAYRDSAKLERAKHLSDDSSYLISYPMQVRLAMTRRYQMQMGEISTLIVTVVAAIFQAIIIGSVYFMMPKDTSGFFSRGGLLFFAILYNTFTGMAEITTAYSQRPVVVRHRRYAMIRPSADILAQSIVDLPFKFWTVFFFDLILFFMTGLQISASQFFVFLFFTWITNVAMIQYFRMLAGINKAEPQATMMAGISVLIIAIYVGYTIPRPSMRVWFRWLSYAQPVSFGFETLITNEFRTLNVPCAILVPSGPGYEGIATANQVCTTLGSRTGEAIVRGSDYLLQSFGYEWANTWKRNLPIIIGYTIFYVLVLLLAAEYQSDESAAGGVMIFKRGAAPSELQATIEGKPSDEESGAAVRGAEAIGDLKNSNNEKEAAADRMGTEMTDVFTWKDVCYDVQVKGKSRRLLNHVSGYVAPGRMTALMGESGAGKTTLLNALAQRLDTGVITGSMFVNGRDLPISFQRQTGYVQQQDTHMATATVREALQFSALLRQPASTPKQEKLDYVEEVIRLLEMEAYAEAIVGEVGIGLSVEQRKRLTIGVELAAKPALLLFLDEPSSGLDSQSAWSIVNLLRKLADHGTAILATIHQPSSELFQVFDRLLLLKKGGEMVYFGDLGDNSSTLVNYFGARSDLKCGPRDNPAEYILEVIGAGASAKSDKDWYSMWKESEECKTMHAEIEKIHNDYRGKQSAADASPDSGRGFAAPMFTQIQLVTHRAFQHYYRDVTYLMGKLMLNIVAGLFIGFTFWDLNDDIPGLQNRLFAVFMVVVLSAPLSQQLQPKFIGLRTLWEAREKPSAMYSWPVLVTANVLVEIPWNIFAGTLLFVCWYWTVGFPNTSDRVGYAYLMYMLFEIYYGTFAQWVAAFSPNAMIASILFSTLFSFVIIFNGVVQPVSQLPYFWSSWMYRLTPFTYLIDGLVSNSLGGLRITCTPQQLAILVPPAGQLCDAFLAPFIQANGGYATTETGACGYCQYSIGDEFLRTVGMAFSHRWRNVGFLCAYIIFNFAMVYVVTYLYSVVDWTKISFKPKKKEAVEESA